jgi:large subunit ribosomal protein L10
MNRQEKEHAVQALKNELAANQAAFVVGYKGLTVAQLTKLRRELHKGGGSFQVSKVSLMERALSEMPALDGLRSYLGDQIAFVFAEKNAPAVAKVLFGFAKENEKLKLVAGCLEQQVIGSDKIKAVASLPSREVLLAQLCGTLQAPSQKLVMMLNLMVVRLCVVLQQAAEKKQAEAAS